MDTTSQDYFYHKSKFILKAEIIKEWIDSEYGGNINSAAKSNSIPYATLNAVYNGNRLPGGKLAMYFEKAGLNLKYFEGDSSQSIRNDRSSTTSGIQSNVNGKPFSVVMQQNVVRIRFYIQPANAGVGVPLDSDTPYDRKVDASLIQDPEKSFCMFASGDSMLGAMIADGSFLLCEQTSKSCEELVGEIVIANVDGVTVVKRLVLEGGIYKLRSESPRKYKDINISDSANCVIQGIVLSTHTDIKNYRPKP